MIFNEGSTSNVVVDLLVEHPASNSTDEASQMHNTSTSTCSPETITIALANNSYAPTSCVENSNNRMQADHQNPINFVSSVPEYVTKDAFETKYSRIRLRRNYDFEYIGNCSQSSKRCTSENLSRSRTRNPKFCSCRRIQNVQLLILDWISVVFQIYLSI
jgi:hypothetical protein